jgi:hypothetical protein
VTNAKTVKVEIVKSFTYRGHDFGKGKVYELDPELVPDWIDHWITRLGHGVVLAAESDREAEPDPRLVVASESGGAGDTSSGAQSPDSDVSQQPSVEESTAEGDSFPERPALDSPEEVKVTSSENVPSSLTEGNTRKGQG